MKEIHARLEAADPAALVAASKRISLVIKVHGKSARVDEIFRTRDAILVGLRGLSGKTTAEDVSSLYDATLELFASIDPAAAEPLLLKLLALPAPRSLRAQAAFSLSGMRSDATVEALFAALHEPGYEAGSVYYNPTRRGAENALGQTGRADVGERALALLTPEALDIPTGDTDEVAGYTFEAREKEDFVRAPLVILRELKYRPARDRLAALFRSHRLWEVRKLAGEAILAVTTPAELRAAFGDEEPVMWDVINTTERLLDHLDGKQAG